MKATEYIATCDECPFMGAIDFDCHAPRVPRARKPSVPSVIRSAEHKAAPPRLCPLRSGTVTVALAPHVAGAT